MILQYYQFNYGMVIIESFIEFILAIILIKTINKLVSSKETIKNVKNFKSDDLKALLISLGIGFGILLILRLSLGSFIRFFNYNFFSIEFFFAILVSTITVFYILFLRKFVLTGESEKIIGIRKLIKNRLIALIVLNVILWIIGIIFYSIEFLNIPIKWNPSENEYDLFIIGFVWAFITSFAFYYLSILGNRFFSDAKRISKELMKKAAFISSIISFSFWSLQLIIVELYLKNLFNLDLWQQDIRIMILAQLIAFLTSLFLLLKFSILPKAEKESQKKLDKALRERKIAEKEGIVDKVILEVKDLKTYFYTEEGIVRAIEEASFEIREDEVLGLVGETGCGKSVTARSIIGLIERPGKIEKGEVIFQGEDLLKKSKKEMLEYRGKKITMTFQDPLNSLNPVFKVGKQINEVLFLNKEDELLIEASKDPDKSIFQVTKKWTIDLLAEVGIPSPENIYDQYPHELSGGMRQRVQIAMAIACSPILLIVDEPTTALDVTVQNQILKLLKRLKEEYKTSILFITHDLGVISKMCDRVAVMYSGYIVEYGNVVKVLTNPQHPYTKGLVSAIPGIGTKKEKLEIIPGSVPNLIYPPSGCRFHPRCPYKMDICSEETPKTIEIKPNYYVSCHLFDDKIKTKKN